MIKKILVVSLALFGMVFSQLANDCLAANMGTLDQAKQNVISLIGSGRFKEADAAANKLIKEFTNTAGVDGAVHQIALKYQEVKNYQKAIELSRWVIINWPQSSEAGWSQMDIVIANLSLGNEAAVQSEVETLISQYKDNPGLPLMLSIIGQGYKSETFVQILKRNFNSESSAGIRLAILNAEVMAKLESSDFDKAGEVVEAMIAGYSSDADLPDMLLFIAQQLVWQHRYEQAGNIYQKIVQRFPDSLAAAKAQKSISKTGQIINILSQQIDSGDYSRVNSAVGELIVKFGDEGDTPAAVYEIANRLESAGQFALARQVYEQIVWRYPKEAWANMSRMGVQRTKVLAFDEIGDEASAKSTFDGVLKDFKGNTYLPSHVIWTAEGYYRMACKAEQQGNSARSKKLFDKAVQTLDVVNAKFPVSDEVPNAYFLTGECYNHLGEYKKSMESYQKVVDKYPADRRAGRSLFMVGRTLEEMQASGFVSGPQVDEAITAAYERLIKDYPNCDTVKLAENRLNRHNPK